MVCVTADEGNLASILMELLLTTQNEAPTVETGLNPLHATVPFARNFFVCNPLLKGLS